MKKDNTVLTIAVLSVFAGSNCLGAIDSALSKIAAAMRVSQTTALYAGTVAALACMFSGMLLGMVVGKKLPYKLAAVLCYVVLVVGGTVPVFIRSFPLLLVTRCIFGFGGGGLMCMQNPIATALVPADRRASILGVGTCVAFGFQCVLQLIGGVLTDIHWNLVFLTYLVLLVPMIFLIVFLPDIPLEPVAEKKQAKDKLPLSAVLICVLLGIVWLNIGPLLFGSAFYVAPITDSAKIAALIAMSFSIGCMVGGLLYPVVYKRVGKYTFSVFLLLAAAGLLLAARATDIPPLAAGFLLGGIGQACLQAGIMNYLGFVCTASQLPMASALMTVALNLGAFLCSSWDALVGRITGDSLYMPLYIGVVIFVVLAAFLFVRPTAVDGRRRA